MGYSLLALVTVFANLMYQKLRWVGEVKYFLLVVVPSNFEPNFLRNSKQNNYGYSIVKSTTI